MVRYENILYNLPAPRRGEPPTMGAGLSMLLTLITHPLLLNDDDR